MRRVPFLLLAAVGIAAAALACDQGATVTDVEVQPLFAKVWVNQVVGGGVLINHRGRTVNMHLAVTDFGATGGVKGQVERHTLAADGTTTYVKFHGVVDGFLIGPHQSDGSTIVNICGTVTAVQEVGIRDLKVGDRFGIKIKDVPDGPDEDGFPPNTAIDCRPGNLQGADEDSFFNGMVEGDFKVK